MELIKEFSLHQFQNEEHYKFHSDFNGLIQLYTPEVLKIEKAYDAYQPLFNGEMEALVYIRKSSYTEQLSAADGVRDTTLQGLEDAIASGTKHFNATVREAANRLKVLWDSYGDIGRKSYDKETATIIKLVSDLRGTYDAELSTVGLVEWVDELERNNNDFEALQNTRYDEQDKKTRLRMKSTRTEVDAAYRIIVNRINSMITLEDEFDFTPFVNKLNLRIDNYLTHVAQRAGRIQSAAQPQSSEQAKG